MRPLLVRWVQTRTLVSHQAANWPELASVPHVGPTGANSLELTSREFRSQRSKGTRSSRHSTSPIKRAILWPTLAAGSLVLGVAAARSVAIMSLAHRDFRSSHETIAPSHKCNGIVIRENSLYLGICDWLARLSCTADAIGGALQQFSAAPMASTSRSTITAGQVI